MERSVFLLVALLHVSLAVPTRSREMDAVMDNSCRGPVAIVVMGVSASGKSSIGEGVAEELGIPFVEGDSLHPEANKAKMKAGIPLTDEDRLGWLQSLSRILSRKVAEGTGAVLACSALKLSYRNILRDLHGDDDQKVVDFVFIQGSYELFLERIRNRKGHFMPPSLLQSQFDTLEVPTEGETISSHLTEGRLVVVNATNSLEDNIAIAAARLRCPRKISELNGHTRTTANASAFEQ